MLSKYYKKFLNVIYNIYINRNNHKNLNIIKKNIKKKNFYFYILIIFTLFIIFIIGKIFLKKIIKFQFQNKKIFYLFSFITLNYFVILLTKKLFNIYRYFISRKISQFILKKNLKKINYYKIKLIPQKKIVYNLSIAIPCYSRSKLHPLLLDKCLSGIKESLKISNLSYEICIFDNASTFSIDRILSKYKDLNIKYKRREKLLSPSDSWYESVKLTLGNYVHIHSCDDEVNKFFYSNIQNLIFNNKVNLIYTAAKYLREFNYKEAQWGWKMNWPEKHEYYFDPNLQFIRHPMPSSSWIVKRKFYEKHGVTANWINGLDLDLSYRLERYNKICYFTKKSFIYYRDHPYSGNNLDNPKKLKELKWQLNKIKFLFLYKDTSIKEKYIYIYNYISHYFFLYFFIHKIIDYNNSKKDKNIKIVNNFIIRKIFLNKFNYIIFTFLTRLIINNSLNIILRHKYHNIDYKIFFINPFYLLKLIIYLPNMIKEKIIKLIK